jgi:hypothetical protein
MKAIEASCSSDGKYPIGLLPILLEPLWVAHLGAKPGECVIKSVAPGSNLGYDSEYVKLSMEKATHCNPV